MNKHLFELLRRIEDSARRLAATIMHNSDKRLRDIASVEIEIKEISANSWLLDSSHSSLTLIHGLTPDKDLTSGFDAEVIRQLSIVATIVDHNIGVFA